MIKCNICGEKFGNSKSMTNHRRWHKIPRYKEFQDSQKTRELFRNENHFYWKGDDVGYASLHTWIKRRKPKPEMCEDCKKSPAYDLSNISGEYKRDINDFKWLCRRCHMKNDGRLNNKNQKGRFK